MFLDPAILFFLLGIFAGAIRSNLEIPQPIVKFLSLYLLMALGLKGGFALSAAGFGVEIVTTIVIGLTMAIVVPLIGLFVLSKITNNIDASAIAATYGSVSAVTFITATQILITSGIDYGGHMAAVMALMETPAILLAMVFANRHSLQKSGIGHIIKESFTDGVNLLLIGSMLIGFVTGAAGLETMAPFTQLLFKGMLAFFLLDMGLLVAKNLRSVISQSFLIPVYAIFSPMIHAAIALALCALAGVTLGNTILLMVLSASASYIAVPAVLRQVLPQANPTMYFGMSLGITFPFNILIGIPLYIYAASIVI